MRRRSKPPIHPGEILQEEFLSPMGMTQEQLARHIDVSTLTINKIVNEKARVTPKLARKFAAAFGTSREFWLNLQMAVDLYELDHSEEALPKRLNRAG